MNWDRMGLFLEAAGPQVHADNRLEWGEGRKRDAIPYLDCRLLLRLLRCFHLGRDDAL